MPLSLASTLQKRHSSRFGLPARSYADRRVACRGCHSWGHTFPGLRRAGRHQQGRPRRPQPLERRQVALRLPSRAFVRRLWLWECTVRDPSREKGMSRSLGCRLCCDVIPPFLRSNFYYRRRSRRGPTLSELASVSGRRLRRPEHVQNKSSQNASPAQRGPRREYRLSTYRHRGPT